MIDFIKLKVNRPNIIAVRNNTLLAWDQTANEGTGEVKELTAEYYGIKLAITANKYLEISGSLHKHLNAIRGNGLQNYNDFNYSDLSQVVQSLCLAFELDPEQCKLENIEYGVNIICPVEANKVIQAAINHRGQPFTREYGEKKRFRECIHQRYIVKIYNKGLQYDRPENILRFELKILKMEQLKGTGLNTLEDITKPEILTALGKELRENFAEILFYGLDINLNNLNTRDRLVLSEGRNAQYWTDLKKENRNVYKKRRERFIALVQKHSSFNISEMIGQKILEKWIELLGVKKKTLPILTGGQTLPILTGGFTHINRSGKGLICHLSENEVTESLEQKKVISVREWKPDYRVPVYDSKTGSLIEFLDLTNGKRTKTA